MFKRFDHVLFALALGILSFLSIGAYVLGIPILIPTPSSARIPAAVGNKAAPVPVLNVQRINFSNESNLTSSQLKSSIASSVGGQGISAQYQLKEYLLQWLVTVEDGSLAPVTAQVFVPVSDNPQQQFPIIVYGAGTTGLADRCAPSREDLKRGNMGNYRNYMISEASQGYIVAMPNYEGLDNPNRDPHYFNRDSEARTMLSTVKALVTGANQVSLPLKPGAVFLGGYSQGGHAAFSAADYASQYLPDIKISGIYGHGPTTKIVDFLKSNPNLAAYFVQSYSQYYPVIDPAKILKPEWIGYLKNAQTVCVDEGFGINSTTLTRVFTDDFRAALLNNTLGTAFPEIKTVFDENNAGTSYQQIPTMIVEGTSDPIVTPADQNVFVNELCQRGIPVDLKLYYKANHFVSRQVSFKDTNTWINAITNGQSVNNSCEK